MSIIYREATSKDFPTIVDLFEAELLRDANRTYIRESISNHPAALALDAGKAIGFTYCGYMAPDVLELANITIANKYRNQGVGSKLLVYTESLIALHADAVMLTNSALYGEENGKRNAESFYLRNGYSLVAATGKTNLFWKNLA